MREINFPKLSFSPRHVVGRAIRHIYAITSRLSSAAFTTIIAELVIWYTQPQPICYLRLRRIGMRS